MRIRNEHLSASLATNAVTVDNFKYFSYKVASGRFLSSVDLSQNNNEIVLSSVAAKKLKFNPARQTHVSVKLKNTNEISLKVVGIIDPSSEQRPDSGNAWLSHSLYEAVTGSKTYTDLTIVAQGAQWMDWLENFSTEYFSRSLGADIRVSNPVASFLERKKKLVSFIQISYFLGFLALLAGSIGSTSLMILNVNLRRKEIGLYKSMGFSSGIILFQFSCESFLSSFLGGSLGAVSGCILGYLVSLKMFEVAALSLSAALISLASALAIGLLFGLIPAVIAAHTDPVKALQG